MAVLILSLVSSERAIAKKFGMLVSIEEDGETKVVKLFHVEMSQDPRGS